MAYIREIELCPTEIRFMHENIYERFGRRRSRGDYVNDVIEKISDGRMNVYTLPKIRVVRLEHRNNYYFAFDNRRLYVYRVLHHRGKLDTVKVKLASPDLFRSRRFNTLNNGKSVTLKSDFAIPTTLSHSHAVSPPPSPPPILAQQISPESSPPPSPEQGESVRTALTSILKKVVTHLDAEDVSNRNDASLDEDVSEGAGATEGKNNQEAGSTSLVLILDENSSSNLKLKSVMNDGDLGEASENQKNTEIISTEEAPQILETCSFFKPIPRLENASATTSQENTELCFSVEVTLSGPSIQNRNTVTSGRNLCSVESKDDQENASEGADSLEDDTVTINGNAVISQDRTEDQEKGESLFSKKKRSHDLEDGLSDEDHKRKKVV